MAERASLFPDLPPWHLVTDSSLPDEHYVRETAIVLMARDVLVPHDSSTVENAVRWSRAMFDDCENEAHDGDCTNQPMTCNRCVIDEAKREAREVHDDE